MHTYSRTRIRLLSIHVDSIPVSDKMTRPTGVQPGSTYYYAGATRGAKLGTRFVWSGIPTAGHWMHRHSSIQLTTEQRFIVEQWHEYIVGWVDSVSTIESRWLFNRGPQATQYRSQLWDELYAVGIDALIQTVLHWKPDHGATFRTYLHNYLKWRRIGWRQDLYWKCQHETLKSEFRFEDEPAAYDEPTIETDEAFLSLLNKLTRREREFITLRFLNNEPLTTIARRYGITKQAVSQTIERALTRLRGTVKCPPY